MTKRQSSLIFIGSLVITGVLLVQIGFYACSTLAGCNMKFNFIAACQSWLKAFGLSSLKYVLNGLVLFTLSFSIWKISSQWIQTVRMKRRFQQYKEKKLTDEISRKYGRRKEGIIVLSHPTPMAFTMGLIDPKIIITTGLIYFLHEEELQAVIAHEKYHQENRDPLKVFLLSLGASAIWYIPIQKWFYRQYSVVQEVLADQFAIQEQKTSVNLGSALLKMLKVGKQEKMPFTYVSFAATSINYRIEHILNPIKDVQLQLPFKLACISFMTFSLICGLFIYALA